MRITKKITNDGKEKHSSYELTIGVPTMKVPDELAECGGYVYPEEAEYSSFHGSLEEANRAFMIFLEALSRQHNKHISEFEVEFLS